MPALTPRFQSAKPPAKPAAKPASPRRAGPAEAVPDSGAEPAVGARRDPRRRVLDAAIACFTRAGFHGTSMQQICAEAGMSPGALYRYFPSKEAIIIAIVDEERAMRMNCLALLESAPSFVDGLARMAEVMFGGQTPMVCLELGPEIYAEAARNPALKPTFDAVEDEMNAAIRAHFVAAQARGEIDASIDPDIAMLMLNAIGDGLVLRNSFEPGLPLVQMMPALAGLIARMLAPAATPPLSPDRTP
ncbi:TetR/AcrR family transcriptional regulator [Ancylobacter dichloromethanicus]|uniref:TetR family transcriptional regulator n=1 Tax=Ancylobacter dichloromethanicus TaxID=518825 RepID=A0A9W6N0C9_9HYPH|nr:TetR/AcrR family transcriptional regulator [Ancylobacter dichloromethanicus]MBS7553282.1 TetR/AcrR family transcriptional regulator [Ancylobacter dichloromethanicus]GLK73063.1 TetR family transcriptional regulator [Ancylobacter dichloromethanicus]